MRMLVSLWRCSGSIDYLAGLAKQSGAGLSLIFAVAQAASIASEALMITLTFDAAGAAQQKCAVLKAFI